MPFKKHLLMDEQLFFIHVPKCAGTSFISLLDEIFVNSEICPTHYDLRKFGTDITDDDLRRYKFIRGHLPYELIVPKLTKHPRIITFLRDPVVQFISYFNMRQRVPDPISGLHMQIKDLTLEEFLGQPLLFHIVSNNITKLFAGLPNSGKLFDYSTTININLAKQRLEECEFIGITEEYDTSIEMFSYIFDFPLPSQQRELNVSLDRDQRQSISPQTLERIAEIQYADMELYKHGQRLFQQMLEKMASERTKDAKSTRPMTTIKLEEKLDFDFHRVTPGMGWQVGEEHPLYKIIRWSGPSAISKLYLPIEKETDAQIRFNVIAWITEEILDSLELFVNDEKILIKKEQFPTSNGYIFSGIIPKEILEKHQGISEFTFRVKETLRPADLDSSNPDERQLGLCYTWLSVEPSDNPALTQINIMKKPLLQDEQLYFIHVPKCAGTSFISLIDERYVIDKIIPTHYDIKMLEERITDEQLASYRFIRGHLPYDMVVPRLPKAPRIITFLREPVVRLISNFQMRQRVSDPLQGLQSALQSLTLEEFLDRQDLLDIFANRATRLIGGTIRDDTGGEIPNLERAKERLATFDFVGIVERYNDALDLFCYVFDHPRIVSDRTLNISPDREKRSEISQNTLERVAEIEWADIELYKFGRELFEQQFNKMNQELKNKVEYRQPEKTNRINYDFSLVEPGMGWHVAEGHPDYGVIRWSGSETASHLYFPLNTEKDLKLQFRIINAIAPDVLDSLSLAVNGKPINLTRYAEGSNGAFRFEAHIPRDVLMLANGMTKLTFEVSRTVQPREIDPKSSDERHLGLCYHWLSLFPA